jgi:DNA-binding CsgD family transcriptional regulator
MRKQGYHYYVGNDLSNFRFPDQKLLDIGNPLSNREFEILLLIESGLTSEEIGEKLFLSKFTIDTHRRNILEKTGKTKVSEVINDFHRRGLF